jgi:FAD-dependent sensor of blue light
MLSQLVYVSNRKAACTDEEIEKILASCKKNNPPLNITGILLYSDTKFIQLVEGEYKMINDLYNKIKTDSRHDQTRLISLGPIQKKAFPSWHMGTRKITGSEVDFKTSISTEDREAFKGLLSGKEENGQKVLGLLQKFF